MEFVLDGVTQTRQSPTGKPLKYQSSRAGEAANQYCLFLKPWITDPGVDIRRVLRLVVEKIDRHGLFVDEVAILPGPFLKKYDLVAGHYWALKLFACAPRLHMTASMRRRFRKFFNADPYSTAVVGGYDFLDQFNDISPFALELLWENVQQHRLGDGCYGAKVTVADRELFLVNGFVPGLMNAYVRADSVIVVFSLKGGLPWSGARKRFVGGSDPAKAAAGSLRNELFLKQADLGLSGLRLGANGVHLSAGPIEALVELRRFTSLTPERPRPLSDFQCGRKLQRTFTPVQVQSIIRNAPIQWKNREISVFELTAERNESLALQLLAKVRDQLSNRAGGAQNLR